MKQFIGVWGEGYMGADKEAIIEHDMTPLQFGDDNGYSDEDREQIEALGIGEAVMLRGIFEVHTLVRVK